MADIGFVPCFARYRDRDYSLLCIYKDNVSLRRVKDLFCALLEAKGQQELKSLTGQEIKPLRPGESLEMDRVLKLIDFPEGTPLRVDYGKNKFRIILGLSNEGRGKIAYIFMISDDHKDFSGKQRRR